jgi:hypothetical protein
LEFGGASPKIVICEARPRRITIGEWIVHLPIRAEFGILWGEHALICGFFARMSFRRFLHIVSKISSVMKKSIGRFLLLLSHKNFVIFCDRDQYFALAVVRGVVELRYNLGTGPAVIKTKTRVNTGKEIEVN